MISFSSSIYLILESKCVNNSKVKCKMDVEVLEEVTVSDEEVIVRMLKAIIDLMK